MMSSRVGPTLGGPTETVEWDLVEGELMVELNEVPVGGYGRLHQLHYLRHPGCELLLW